MEALDVLLIAIPVLLGLAVLLVVATTISRQRSSTGSLGARGPQGRQVEPRPRWWPPPTSTRRPGPATTRPSAVSNRPSAGRPALTAAGGLIRFGEAPADPEQLGVNRRHVLQPEHRGRQSLVLGTFGAGRASPSCGRASGGFGGAVRRRRKDAILDEIKTKRAPVLRAGRPQLPRALPRIRPPQGERVYQDPLLAGHGSRVRRPVPEVPAPGLPGSVVPVARSGSSAPAMAPSTTGSAKRRVVPPPAAWTAGPSQIDANGNVAINTSGLVAQGPAIGVNTTGQEAEGPNCV